MHSAGIVPLDGKEDQEHWEKLKALERRTTGSRRNRSICRILILAESHLRSL